MYPPESVSLPHRRSRNKIKSGVVLFAFDGLCYLLECVVVVDARVFFCVCVSSTRIIGCALVCLIDVHATIAIHSPSPLPPSLSAINKQSSSSFARVCAHVYDVLCSVRVLHVKWQTRVCSAHKRTYTNSARK